MEAWNEGLNLAFEENSRAVGPIELASTVWPASCRFCWVVFVPLLQFQSPCYVFNRFCFQSILLCSVESIWSSVGLCILTAEFLGFATLMRLSWEESQDLSEKFIGSHLPPSSFTW